MNYIDVHCHLDMLENISEVVARAKNKKIKFIVTNCVDVVSNKKALELCEKYDIVKCALGIYPINTLGMDDEDIEEEVKFIEENKDKIIAIGEVGLDFKEDQNNWERQKKIFGKFIKLSIKLNKPIIVHSRKAEKECVEILEKFKAEKVLMHCFSGKFSLVKRIVENGWFLSIPTNVIFSEHFQKISREIQLDKLLCETDSPYLHPNKKFPNEPANVVESYKMIAKLKELSLKEVKEKVYDNYEKLFG